MLRFFSEGYVKGIGFLRFGTREVFNLAFTNDKTQLELCVNFTVSKKYPIHFAFTIASFTIYIQFFCEQF